MCSRIFKALEIVGGPSQPHILQSPICVPLHPGETSLPSKLRINSSPCAACSEAKSKLCCMIPTGTSVGYPISIFLKLEVMVLGS